MSTKISAGKNNFPLSIHQTTVGQANADLPSSPIQNGTHLTFFSTTHPASNHSVYKKAQKIIYLQGRGMNVLETDQNLSELIRRALDYYLDEQEQSLGLETLQWTEVKSENVDL